MKFSVSLLFAIFFFFQTVTGQDYKKVKIYLDRPEQVSILAKEGFAFDDGFFNKEDNSLSLFLSGKEFRVLSTLGFKYDVLIDDWFKYYNSRERLTPSQRQAVITESALKYGVTGMGYGSMGGFYTMDEVYKQLDTMKARFPQLITSRQSIGNSNENRPIYMVKISDNPQTDENEPEVLYTGLHHAREPQGMTCVLYFMYYLLENYNTDPQARFLVDNREIFFVPVLNPDGYYFNQTSFPDGGGQWRKNRRNNGSGSIGVDLNRNYGPYEYWNSPNGGSSTSPSDNTYRGTAPFSEPEVLAVKNFLLQRKIKACLNYHTYSNLLIYPYGALGHETPDSLIFREYATDMTAMNGYTPGTDLQTVNYSTRGGSDDFMYDGDPGRAKVFAMTPEVGDDGDGFWPEQSRIFPLAQENLRPNIYYALIAGEYVSLADMAFDHIYFNPSDTVKALPSIKNKGLSTAYNVNVTMTSLSSYVTVLNGSLSADSIRSRTVLKPSNPFKIFIAPGAPSEHEASLVVISKTGSTVLSRDTVKIMIGSPVFVFSDTTNNPALLWNTASTSASVWSYTTSDFHSAPGCYTDSKSGDYSNNTTSSMELKNSIALSPNSAPKLSFWTKYDLEAGWDYGQVLITTNNGSTWTPLAGKYTKPGSGSYQPSGQPVYNGNRASWVKEEISLSQYAGKSVKLKFQMKTDAAVAKDGWYLDDIAVFIYSAVPVELASFTAALKGSDVLLEWVTASETNNSGFRLERSKNNKEWAEVSFIKGRGTTTEKSRYTYTDEKVNPGSIFYRLVQMDYNGSYRILSGPAVKISQVYTYSLSQNYPNPFNPATRFDFSLAKDGMTELKIYNSLGEEAAVIVSSQLAAGRHSAGWNAAGYPSGMYFYRLKSGSFVKTGKLVLLK